ncbi:major coat protein [Vibrio alginolyticus]|uniref:major coat protein n=1 Tax=Vibrio alginolyticus TaxID=663 RepID=UPI003747B83A
MEKQSKVRAAMAKAGAVVTAKRATFGGALLMAASGAHAALPEQAAQAFTSLGTFVTDMLTSTWGIAVPLTVGFIGIKLFKKGANKAT